MHILLSNILKNNLERFGDNILFKENDTVLTYREVEERTNQFAEYIKSFQVKKQDRVVLMMDTTIHGALAVVGCIKAGAVFVPLNTSMGSDNINEILQETEAALVIADEHYCGKIMQCDNIKKRNIPVICNGQSSECLPFEHYREMPESLSGDVTVFSRDLVYIIYTSGTTGKPKGIMMTHENIMPFMTTVTRKFAHNEQAVTLAKCPLSFDPYLTEIIPSFIGGGRIVFLKNSNSIRSLLKTIEKEGITNFGCGPSLLLLLAENEELVGRFNLDSMKEIYFGYENCPVDVVRRLQEMLPHITYINGYGTSETYASSTFYEVPPLKDLAISSIPIGWAIDNTELIILEDGQRVLEPGVIGELVLRGPSLTNGYWKQKELTDSVFRVNPLFPESFEKVYFTGDLVKYTSEGEIVFVGRKDNQVKINGYRVELLDVQHHIEKHPAVEECCVIAVDSENSKKLVSFLVLKPGFTFEKEEMLKHCVNLLESYKVPGEWQIIDKMPRNANSKVDRKALDKQYCSC